MLQRGDNLPEVTADATLVSDIDLIEPAVGSVFKWGNSNTKQTVKWTCNPDNTVFFDVKMNITYDEADASTPTDFTRKTLVWDVLTNFPNDDNEEILQYRIPVAEFYGFLKANIPVETNTIRKLINLEIIVAGGGVDLFEYINVGRANTGITSSQILPTYTNLSEGFGILSSRTISRSSDHLLENNALDSLRSGLQTVRLNFQ